MLPAQVSNLDSPGPKPGGSAISPTGHWCARRDLNPQDRSRCPLKAVRLPFHHSRKSCPPRIRTSTARVRFWHPAVRREDNGTRGGIRTRTSSFLKREQSAKLQLHSRTVRRQGLEPRQYGLRVRCSAIELAAREAVTLFKVVPATRPEPDPGVEPGDLPVRRDDVRQHVRRGGVVPGLAPAGEPQNLSCEG